VHAHPVQPLATPSSDIAITHDVLNVSCWSACCAVVVLLGRMPHLDPNRPRDIYTSDHETRASPITRVAPYQPLKPPPKVELPPVHITVRFSHYPTACRRKVNHQQLVALTSSNFNRLNFLYG